MNRLLIIVMILIPMLHGCQDRDAGGLAVQHEETTATHYSPVTVEPLQRGTFMKELVTNGRLEAWRKVDLQFETAGTVAAVNVSEGETVSKGQILASLDKESLKRQLERADIAFEKSRITLSERLLDYGYAIDDTAGIPPAQKRVIYLNSGYLEAQMALADAHRNFSLGDLRAPFDGKVAGIDLQAYRPAGTLCTLVDDSCYTVRFPVLETEYGLVHKGQKILVSPFAAQSLQLTGTILSVSPTVSENGQIAVTARVPGNSALMDGMNVRVTIQSAVPDQLVVPKSAVVLRNDMEVLFLLNNGRSRWTYVNVLMSNSGQYAVEANRDRGATLEAGDTVITGGNLNLGDGTAVTVVQ